jgi:anti-sigma B factor antagonist
MAKLKQTDVCGVTVLEIAGTLDRAEVAGVERSFYDATDRDGAAVVLDLTNVDYLSTPAITMFLDAARTLRGTGGRIVATGARPHVGEVLRRLRLDEILPVTRTVGEGVRRVRGDGACV